MRIYNEINLEDFGAWSGGQNTLNRIINNGLCDELEANLEELYPEGIDETELNDILRFDSDSVFEMVGLPTEEEIREELSDLENEYKELTEEYKEQVDDEELSIPDSEALWKEDYEERCEEIQKRIDELNEELSEF